MTRAYIRNGYPVVPFGPRDDVLAERLRVLGWSIAEIGRHLERSKSSVRNRLELLARRAESDEEEIQSQDCRLGRAPVPGRACRHRDGCALAGTCVSARPVPRGAAHQQRRANGP
jgi:hypothetical protein